MSSSRDARTTLDALLHEGVVLCVRLSDGERVVELARAAAEGGLRVLEITLTTPGALEAIERLAAEPDLIVGAGTVLSTEDVERVVRAGGRFALSPVCDAPVLEAARRHALLAIPGAATPTEVLTAHRCGAPLVKVFPSGALGGPAWLRAVRGPLPHVPLLPTSGPTIETMAAWFEAGASAVGVGAEVLDPGEPGVALEEVRARAARVRAAVDRARA